jgi:hypothetical protein
LAVRPFSGAGAGYLPNLPPRKGTDGSTKDDCPEADPKEIGWSKVGCREDAPKEAGYSKDRCQEDGPKEAGYSKDRC